jgi:hypothetical protein
MTMPAAGVSIEGDPVIAYDRQRNSPLHRRLQRQSSQSSLFVLYNTIELTELLTQNIGMPTYGYEGAQTD